MAAVLEDPRTAADAITHQSEQAVAPQVNVQEQHAPGTPGQEQRQPTQVARPENEFKPLTKEELLRPAFGALATTLGAAFLVGGMFVGFSPIIYAALGGIAGVGLAVAAAQARKRATLMQILSVVGILIVGALLLSIPNFGNLSKITTLVGEAAKHARLKRPPAPFDEGWKAILPWTVGMIGYAAAWVGSMGRKPAVGVLVPIPAIAFAAIGQPAERQVISGIIAFVSFVIGLTVIFRADKGEGGSVSTAYEIKRAARAAPLVILLIGALFALAQTNLLFPAPLYDPAQRAQLPRPIPLSGVKDRVIFSTAAPSGFTGPWRLGVLDVYDGTNWRLPPYAKNNDKDLPLSGIIDEDWEQPVTPRLVADVRLEGLDGTHIPIPALLDSIGGDHLPKLVGEKRSQTIGVKEGSVPEHLEYKVNFGLLPQIDVLKGALSDPSKDFKEFLDVADRQAPPAVAALIQEARDRTTTPWDRLDYIRGKLLENVTAAGQGLPGPIPPSKINEMVSPDGKANPYEIVAAQAVLARWAGIPARVGYGFDNGRRNEGRIEFHPSDGAAWLEVHFEGIGWFPVTGFPKKVQASLGNDPKKEGNFIASDQVKVQLFIPLRIPPKNVFLKQFVGLVVVTSPFIIMGLLAWLLWPVVWKARRRGRRHEWALEQGRAARIAVAYAELRDMATDLGVGDPYGTPLAYLSKVVPDEEHRELAWLVTRTLWGDLRESLTDDEVFAAEELSRSLRRRMSEAQPFTIRGIALVSRLSLRNPYAPELVSPPVERVEVRKRVRALASALASLRKPPRRAREREMPDEAMENA